MSHPLRLAAGLSDMQIDLLLAVALGRLPRGGSPSERASRSRALRRLERRGLLHYGGRHGAELTEQGLAVAAYFQGRRAC
ncbi:hypothetical protein DYH09_13845 [bacterium CPR1]|nr:hypothetical protein [bacterium CPR1]